MAKEKNIGEKKGQTRSTRLPLSVDTKLQSQMDLTGIRFSEWIREAVVGNKMQLVVRQRKSIDAKRIIFLVNKSSNNINQISHNINAAVKINTIAPRVFEAALFELKALNDFLQKAAKDAD